ncbi:MAG: DoxX family protein [Halococcoides sp.]
MVSAIGLLIGRLLFGGVIAFMGLNHFQDVEGLTAYAEAKGLPVPRATVVASGIALVAGGVGIAIGAFAVVAGLLVAGFLLIAAVTMHDFWAVEDTQTEMTQFLKNVALAGGAIAIAATATDPWSYAIGIGLV